MSEVTTTKVVIGPVRLSYLNVWEPKAIDEGSDPKYSASLIIPKKVKGKPNPDLAKIEKAIEAAKEAGKAKYGGKIPANLKLPLRDGDEERPDDEAYEGAMFINASAKTMPGVVDKNRQPITKQDELYSGCYAWASVTFYAFNTSGNKGVACGLNHIMKAADGTPLGGRSTAESDFAEVETGDFDDDDFLN